MSTLFRPESLAAKNGSWLGTVRLNQPISYWFVATTGLVVASLIGAFGALGTYTKTATVPGVLQPPNGAVRLTNAGSGGVLTELHVREGSTVAAGDVLFTINSERMSELGGAQALIGLELKRRTDIAQRDELLSRQRAAERVSSGQQRISAIELDIASFDRDAMLHAAREKLAVEALERLEKLAEKGFMSSAQVDPKREELLALQAQQQQLLRSKAALARERSSMQQQIAEVKLQVQTEASELAKARAALGQEIAENSARTKLVVAAPQAGVIAGVSVQRGQTVVPGALLATLLPPDKASEKQGAPNATATMLEAHFYATTRQAGFVKPGQRVLLRYAAYPYQKFGMGEGEVAEISRSPYAVQELPTHLAAMLGHVAQSGDAVYRVTVRIKDTTVRAYGEAHTLKPGMVAEADIVQDTRRLWEWALEPIFSVSGKQI